MRCVRSALTGVAAFTSCPALADDGVDCGIYDGKPIHFSSLPKLAETLAIKKSEFETSAEFESRRDRQRRTVGAFKVIKVEPAVSEVVRPRYFADQSVVGFSIFGWGLDETPLSSVIPQDDWNTTKWMDDKNAFAFHVGYTAVANGSYSGSNIFGARVNIKREKTANNYFIHRGRDPSEWIWIIPYSAKEAQSVVRTYKPALVIDVSGGDGFKTSARIEPTVDAPYDVDLITSVVSGRLVCGLYYDAGGIVRAVFDPDVIEDKSSVSVDTK